MDILVCSSLHSRAFLNSNLKYLANLKVAQMTAKGE